MPACMLAQMHTYRKPFFMQMFLPTAKGDWLIRSTADTASTNLSSTAKRCQTEQTILKMLISTQNVRFASDCLHIIFRYAKSQPSNSLLLVVLTASSRSGPSYIALKRKKNHERAVSYAHAQWLEARTWTQTLASFPGPFPAFHNVARFSFRCLF